MHLQDKLTIDNKRRTGDGYLVVNAIWGEMPGRIVSFDPATQTATVKALYKPRVNGVTLDIPELLEVPVRFPRVGGFVMTYPVKPGDKVNLRPQMRSTEAYEGDDGFESSDARMFHISDMQAFLDGGEPVGQPIQNFNSSNMEIRSADGQFAIEMSEDGKFKIRGIEGISSLMPGPNTVRVGFWKGETDPIDIQKAVWNEFGTRGGASGGGWGSPIPERPFMRNALRDGQGANRAMLKSEARRIVLSAVQGASVADAKRMALRRLGTKIQGDIQASIASLTTPPNSPVTIALKGSSKPLIDTGKMSASVAYMVEE